MSNNVLLDVLRERERQVIVHGLTALVDDRSTLNEWQDKIGRELDELGPWESPAVARAQLVKIAAVAIAAVESIDRVSVFSEAQQAYYNMDDGMSPFP